MCGWAAALRRRELGCSVFDWLAEGQDVSSAQVVECLRAEARDNLKREVNFAPAATPPAAAATGPAQCGSSDSAPRSGETFPDVRPSGCSRTCAAEVQASPGPPAAAPPAPPEQKSREVSISRQCTQAAQSRARCC